MYRLLAVLLLAAHGGGALLPAQTPDSTRTFSSTHIDSTRVYFTQVVFQPPRVDTFIDTLWCTADKCSVTPPQPDPPHPVALGVPFGPFALWSGSHPATTALPFSLSQNYTSPQNVVSLIASARAAGQKLILALTGGGSALYSTNGAFDLAKWQARVDQYNTAPIRDAIAAGVADGTVLGNSLMDEPERKDWGGVMTKPRLDSMAAYAKQYFPTLPMGVNHGANAYYTWRTGERYTSVDYVQNNYVWYVTNGDVAAYRDKVLAQARLDGVAVGFSLNILDGGVKIAGCTSGTACCPLSTTGGLGTFAGAGGQNCRMTAANVRDWGRVLGVAGCMMLMWRYEDKAMGLPDNQQAMRDVAATLAKAPRRGCVRDAERYSASATATAGP